ncbi:non-ribosomal peptide synthetase [Plantactinospora sp. BB1]|uniref:non-ribosomal peptide synthetase n=1 Tax=Plantactinospora sp. BB1 TaxID=2071627 RepID=UPI000D169B47|nr:non-ribosomal peptide synthetase [Plantactinospora sp. BB1]AVT35246.1 hypothetical protein C6W10_00810 [Plantactinospora sp. BB1]
MSESQDHRLRADALSPAKRALLMRALAERAATADGIPRHPERRSGPMSFAQQRIWFMHQYAPESPALNDHVALRMHGRLDVDTLTRALREVVARHDVLRTGFHPVDGVPTQTVADPPPVEIPVRPVPGTGPADREATALRIAREHVRRPFDIARPPLLRPLLLAIDPEDHLFVLAMHQVALDGWSLGVLTREIVELYRAYRTGAAAELPELPIQYLDFARWQRANTDRHAGDLDYWRRQLDGAPPLLELPTDRPRAADARGDGDVHRFTVPAPLLGAVDSLAEQTGTSRFMVLLAVFEVLLARHSGEADICVGVPVANRNRPETENLIGFFVNTLVLRLRTGGATSFREVLDRVRQTALDAFGHQDLPFERLVEELQPERDLRQTPLFQVMFVLQNVPRPEVELPGLTVRPAPLHNGTAKYDLTLELFPASDGLLGLLEYSTELFDRDRVARMSAHYLTLLRAVVDDPGADVARVPLLTGDDYRRTVLEWNDTAVPEEWPGCVHHLVERQAARTPDAVAVRCGADESTYAGLNARANRIAHALLRRGTGRGDIVAVLARRGVDYLALLLGILKTGAAYLPIEPDAPAERLADLVRRSRSRTVVAGIRLDDLRTALDTAPPGGSDDDARPRIVPLAELTEVDGVAGDEADPAPRGGPGDLAYVLYTSGSTGVPKGAMVEHAGMLNHVTAKLDDCGVTAGDVVAQNGPQSFDVSVWQFLAPLVRGAAVEVFTDEVAQEPARLLAEVARTGVTVLQVVPAVLRGMVTEAAALGAARPALGRLRWMVPTGDALQADLCREWFGLYPHVPVLNTYGSTECSDDQCHLAITGPDQLAGPAVVAIGTPIRNMRAYVLDRYGAPQPVGLPGELHIGGIGVGRGYLDDPVRTAEVFVPDPFSALPGARLYRTRDLVRQRPDGVIDFLGRTDHVVKVRGHRIEPGEVEAALNAHPRVHESVVVARAEAGGEKRLVAYLVPAGDAAADGTGDGERVAGWRGVFDEVYGQDTDDTGLSRRVWTSSYTRRPLPDAEIAECVADTVGRIRALRPRRILELGCGTGLLLRRLAPHCDAYHGTDLSAEAVRRLRAATAGQPGMPELVLRHQAADDFAGIAPGDYDVVVVNEVVQYLPGVDYLRRVLAGAARAVRPGGAVFVGGVRSLPLLRAFHASVALANADPQSTVGVLAREVDWAVRAEKELAVDPEFFTAVLPELPGIGAVEIELKGGRGDNEFTRFRYDVTLRAAAPAPDGPVRVVGSPAGFRDALAVGDGATVLLRGVRNARLAEPAALLDLLADADTDPDTPVRHLRDLVAARAAGWDGVDPADLVELADKYERRAVVSWSGTSPTAFDVVCRPANAATGQEPVRATRAALPASWDRFGNTPMSGAADDRLVEGVRDHLRQRLPGHLVPDAFVVLAALPLNTSGKVDRKALPAPGRASERPYVPPSTETERAVAEIWTAVLDVERVGADARFFELGGHSLLATQVQSRVRDRFAVELPLRSMFEHDSVAALAAEIDRRSVASAGGGADLAGLVTEVEGLSDAEVERMLEERGLA